MARPAVFTWPAPAVAAVAALQTTAGAGSLVLNGSLVNPNNYPPFAAFPGIQRTVSLTVAVANLSGVNFTITGTLRGQAVSETRVGPNNNTVETTQLFETVTSVTVDGAVGTAVSVGTGTTGYTNFFESNYHATVVGLAVQVVVASTISFDFQTTLDDVNSNASPTMFAPIDGASGSPGYPADMTGQTASTIAFVNIVTRFSRIKINSSTTGSLVATFLQEGIT